MGLIVFLVPYFALPLCFAYKQSGNYVENTGFPYLTYAICLFIWPFIFDGLSDFYHRKEVPYKCTNDEANLMLFNVIVLIPLALTIQLVAKWFWTMHPKS